MDFRWVYKSAATVFADLVSRVPDDRWDAPGLGEWSVRELTAHTASSALLQVPPVLATRAASPVVLSPEAYWVFARTVPAEIVEAAHRASVEDAKATATALGADVPAAILDATRAATAALSAVADDDVVETVIGGMRVRDWLSTRTFELVVHGLDLARAAAIDVEFAPEALSFTASQAARVAIAVGDGASVLRALTGREALPAGYSIL